MDFNNLLKRLAAISETQVREDDVEENAFNQAAADAAKQHKKEFEFPKGSGKMHPVKMDTSTAHKISEMEDTMNETVDLEECYGQAMMSGQQEESGMNINASTDTRTGHKSLTVTAQGQAAEQLAQLLKLSGISSANPGHEAEMEEAAYANEPDPETQGVEVQMQQGTDMHRPKNSYPKVAGGDNPMAMREARELAEIEQRLNEELAAFKVVAEADIEEGWRDAAAAGLLSLGLAGGMGGAKAASPDQMKPAAVQTVTQDQFKGAPTFVAGKHFSIPAAPGKPTAYFGGGHKSHKYDLIDVNSLEQAPKPGPNAKYVFLKMPDKGYGGKTVKAYAPDEKGSQLYIINSTNESGQTERFTEAKGKKPDFFDMDKDGDKKEPMKKALADKSKKKVSEEAVAEKAVSQQQQKFMGMVHAMQKGEKVKGASPELKKAAKSMNKKAAKDYASTKHKGLPKKVKESIELTEADLETLIKKFGMAAVTSAALAGLGGTAQARPSIDDPGSYKVPVPISAPAQQQQSSELQDLARYGVKAVKDLGNDFTQVRFQDRDGVFDGHTDQIYFYSSKTDGLEKVKIKDGRMTTDYTSASDIGPMTRAAFQKAGIPILQGGGINIGNKSPADGAVRPYFASQSQPGSPKPKSATIQ